MNDRLQFPPPKEILAAQPLPKALAAVKRERDRLCEEVLSGKSEKLLFIVGPCSAHDVKAVLEYVKKLGKLNERVKDKLVLIPRIYTNKPRSLGKVDYRPLSQLGGDRKADFKSCRACMIYILASKKQSINARIACKSLTPRKGRGRTPARIR